MLVFCVEAFKLECLKSYSDSRTGEVIKKFDFPSVQTLTEVQHDNRIIDMMHQVVRHAFNNNTNAMTNSFQNAMVKAIRDGAAMKFSGPS